MQIHMIYITTGSIEEANTIGKVLVESRLVACVNIIDNMQSMYWWEGEIQNDREVIFIAKTTEAQVETVIEKVKEIHSYDCPCIVSFPIAKGNPAFLDWIADEVNS